MFPFFKTVSLNEFVGLNIHIHSLCAMFALNHCTCNETLHKLSMYKCFDLFCTVGSRHRIAKNLITS